MSHETQVQDATFKGTDSVSPVRVCLQVAAKELQLFLASPIAWLLLLIILGSTLTMRMWSEERRTGTLEHVLTQPAPLWSFVVGKFLGCMALLSLAMLILLPLPLSVSLFSDIDWGPGLFWIVGHSVITASVGQAGGELLQNLGTASRFTDITRGVIDVSDVIYYVSLALIFLALTVYVLERERWTHHQRYSHHRKWQWATALLVMNAVALNLWIGQMNTWRVDTTAGKQYTLSDWNRAQSVPGGRPLSVIDCQ